MIKLALAILLLMELFGFGQAALDTVTKAFEDRGIETKTRLLSRAEKTSIDFELHPSPQKKAAVSPAPITSNAFYAVDIDSGRVLAAKNEHKKLPMASLAKMMTALIIDGEHIRDEVVKVRRNQEEDAESQLGFADGETFKVGELMNALLISSANDAARSLAVYNAGSVDKFVVKMNAKAALWKMNNTKFVNPTGLDANGQYSTAYDLSILARVLEKRPNITNATNLKSYTLTNQAGKKYEISSTNQLISSPDIFGLKTGLTNAAGQCFVGYAKNGHRIITVTLGSPDRFSETRAVLDWIYASYIW